MRQSLVSREFVVCLLGTLDPEKQYFKQTISLFVVLNFPQRWFLVRVVLKRRRRKDGPVVCVSFWNNIQKKERERPQKRDRVVKGITALKTTPTLNTHALERERERVVVFERRRFHPLDDRFSYFSKR